MKSVKEKMPEWIGTTRTVLPSKNNITREAKNYRPIGCQSTLYKVCTSLLAHFVQDHGEMNHLIKLSPNNASRRKTQYLGLYRSIIDK